MADFTPTSEQQAIIGHAWNVSARILAGPGTGKSATLVALLNRLFSENPSARVRLLTFTRAATAELALKVTGHSATFALKPSTVHSFAISILLRNPGAGDLPQPLRIADDWEDEHTVEPTLAKRAGATIPRLRRMVQEMAANWESLSPANDPKVTPEERSRFLGAWNEHRKIYGYTLLAELPYALRGTLKDHSDLDGTEFDILVVDEYQDLNACDLDLLKLLAIRGCSIIGAGDDDQSIYSFRKAAPEGIRRFSSDYPGASDYSLSVTQRCGSRIIDWANYVIQGDPDRPRTKPALTSAPGAPPGDVALLSFPGEVAEAKGVADLVHKLVHQEQIRAKDILILLRGDHNGSFSRPIKTHLDRHQIPYSDPEAIKRILGEPNNRKMLEVFRLLVNRDDSLAWAAILQLTGGIGPAFFEFVYAQARNQHVPFGHALLSAYDQGFLGAPLGPTKRAIGVIRETLSWIEQHQLPENTTRWGEWIIATAGGTIVPGPTDDLRKILLSLDNLVEAEADPTLNRYLGQIGPLGKDLAQAESDGVRIMTMAGAKGLTVRATLLAGLEEGIVPRPDSDLGEERRLLYVGMTRAKEFLYCTWARRRRGPTARAGLARIRDVRRYSSFLQGGPIDSQDGQEYLDTRWSAKLGK